MGSMVRGPVINAAGERLRVVEALVAQPHGDGERASAMMAQDDDGLVGVKLGMGARGNVAHGDAGGVGERRRRHFPRLADIQQQGRIGLLALPEVLLGRDFRRQHEYRVQGARASLCI